MAKVVVIGAGPAGMAAATAVAESGAETVLIDESPRPGGQIWRGEGAKDSLAREWFPKLDNAPVAHVRGIVFDVVGNEVLIQTENGPTQRPFEKLILCTGAREIFLPFPGWTLPGVFGMAGLQALVKEGLDVKGKRIVLGGSGPLVLAVAYQLRQAGGLVLTMAEQASLSNAAKFAAGLWEHPDKLWQAIALRVPLLATPFRFGSWVKAAEGEGRVSRARLTNGTKTWSVECDFLGVGYGLTPNLELPRLLGCQIRDGFVQVNEYQETSHTGVYAAGEATGIAGAPAAVAEGQVAGYAAAGNEAAADKLLRKRDREKHLAEPMKEAFKLRPELAKLAEDDTLVCRCEDVSYGSLKTIVTARAARMHTRCGMGPCQARICGPALAHLFGWPEPEPRTPIYPVPLGSLAEGEP